VAFFAQLRLDVPGIIWELETVHPISQYCRDHGLNQKQFAAQVGYTEGFISQLINGRYRCGAQAAQQIALRTEGAISIERLITWRLPAQAAAS